MLRLKAQEHRLLVAQCALLERQIANVLKQTVSSLPVLGGLGALGAGYSWRSAIHVGFRQLASAEQGRGLLPYGSPAGGSVRRVDGANPYSPSPTVCSPTLFVGRTNRCASLPGWLPGSARL